jgi:hypothetical protein
VDAKVLAFGILWSNEGKMARTGKRSQVFSG